ncbi:MAG: hypothetical protein ACLFVS_06295 [Candidatus Acetothermia bacterium]
MKKLSIFLLVLGLIAIGAFSLSPIAFSEDTDEVEETTQEPVFDTAMITIYISAFDCVHGNPVPYVDVTISNPLTGDEIQSGKTDSNGNLMLWYEEDLLEGEDPVTKAQITDIELDKPGSECIVRDFGEYVVTDSDNSATIEKEYCLKNCYDDWKIYDDVDFPGYAKDECPDLLQVSQTRKCDESEEGKRLSPPCFITWQIGDTLYKRECALICSGGYGYQRWVDLRCSEEFQVEATDE